ncbi:MAG: hypothetical protein K5675_02015 [Lachnospiraceae bacterium]|nr:hypothetical protein [Lachnospiraceae bacterium]
MDTVLKAFSGVFMLLLLTAVSVGLIGACLSANAADSYYSDVSKRVSVSNFSDGVILECVNEAKEKGYELEIETSEVNGSGKRVGVGKMTYDFKIPIIGIEKEYLIESNLW